MDFLASLAKAALIAAAAKVAEKVVEKIQKEFA